MRFHPVILLPLAACGPVNQGLNSVHQPIVAADAAYVPGCPDWRSDDAAADLKGSTSSNYGCATATNLAAMIADPNDLLVGKASEQTGHDPFVITKGDKLWRERFWSTEDNQKSTSKDAAAPPAGGTGGGK